MSYVASGNLYTQESVKAKKKIPKYYKSFYLKNSLESL